MVCLQGAARKALDRLELENDELSARLSALQDSQRTLEAEVAGLKEQLASARADASAAAAALQARGAETEERERATADELDTVSALQNEKKKKKKKRKGKERKGKEIGSQRIMGAR